jgi:hypothetical protein
MLSEAVRMKETPKNPSQQLTLFAGATHANPLVMPGSDRARKMTVISGRKCIGSWLPSGPLGSLLKTLLVTSQWASTKCFLTWRPKATPAKRLLFQLAPSTPRTEGIESGLWQTPNANEDRAECYTLETSYRHAQEGRQIHLAQEVRDNRLWPTPTSSQARSEGMIKQMRAKVLAGEITQEEAEAMISGSLEPARMSPMWPTPRAADGEKGTRTPEGHQKERERRGNGVDLPTAAKMWPTPTGQDASNNGGPSQHERNSLPLNAAVMYPTARTKNLCGGAGSFEQLNKLKDAGQITEPERKAMAGGGSLNPTWVEWLMGYPLGWTDLNASETPSSHRSSSGSVAPSSKRKGAKIIP